MAVDARALVTDEIVSAAIQANETYFSHDEVKFADQRSVVRHVLEAVAADIAAAVRAERAAAIQAHADKVRANGTPEARRFARHLEVAVRLVAVPITVEEAAAAIMAAWQCCDLHGVGCEPPSELCCEECPEGAHPRHLNGVACVLDAREATP
jgi:hypothetical protein